MKAIKKQVWSLLNALGLGGLLQLHLKSALKEYGWFRSFHTKRSVDAKGEALPWYTYPFIAFLEPRLTNTLRVFEYGSGNSTRWYAQRVGHITAVEHDQEWVKIVEKMLPKNTTLLIRPLDQTYEQAVATAGQTYQVVVVDGRRRVACVLSAADHLAEDGVLILDNSERDIYTEARQFMQQRGFRSLDFYGMTPIISDESCTTVFYKTGNCLGI
ncbi:class I SAM-dependent methyltransferase [Arundinibacter roseus]|uniref:FkbM family methyltransferase n=1 Tax=Arundinibacter roseus TaxID=2070510 RepID=A0A4R4K442_9BACT|nr:class I SAM-dependent methyltransferase [Arundinibacter roseus]TDB61372.1 FkbM family methyltransferase [Arundinibacter roseus]